MNKFKIIQLIYKINNKFMMEAMVNYYNYGNL